MVAAQALQAAQPRPAASQAPAVLASPPHGRPALLCFTPQAVAAELLPAAPLALAAHQVQAAQAVPHPLTASQLRRLAQVVVAEAESSPAPAALACQAYSFCAGDYRKGHNMHDEEIEAIIAPEYESCLLNAFALTNQEAGDRAVLYGPFWEDYRRVAGIFNAMVPADDLDDGMTAEHAILLMMSVKLGRLSFALQTGAAYENPACVKDSITDLCGYADGLWSTLNNPELELVDEETDDEPDDEDDK